MTPRYKTKLALSKKIKKNEVTSYFSLGGTVFEVNLEDFLHSL